MKRHGACGDWLNVSVYQLINSPRFMACVVPTIHLYKTIYITIYSIYIYLYIYIYIHIYIYYINILSRNFENSLNARSLNNLTGKIFSSPNKLSVRKNPGAKTQKGAREYSSLTPYIISYFWADVKSQYLDLSTP